MEKLLSKKHYHCKLILGLEKKCKPILGIN
jgi:hypothetical protein